MVLIVATMKDVGRGNGEMVGRGSHERYYCSMDEHSRFLSERHLRYILSVGKNNTIANQCNGLHSSLKAARYLHFYRCITL